MGLSILASEVGLGLSNSRCPFQPSNLIYAKVFGRHVSAHQPVCVFSRKICPRLDGNFCQVSVFVSVILSA